MLKLFFSKIKRLIIKFVTGEVSLCKTDYYIV